MRRYKLAGGAVLMFLAAVSTGRSDDQTDPLALITDPPTLISFLANPDPVLRTEAVQRLTNLGEAARPALRGALVSAALQTRSEIDQILLHIPWVKPGDSDAVEEAFTGYAELDAEARCVRIDNWLASPQDAGAPALLRVVLNDPSPAVRWEAASKLRRDVESDPGLVRQLMGLVDGTVKADQPYLPAQENAPVLALAGWGCRLTASKRATDLMEQAVQMEEDHPSAFLGQMDFAFQYLIDRATAAGDHARVVALLRQQAGRTAWNDDQVPDAVSSLFAEQADFGPLDGFADDIRCYREYFTHPEMIYALGRLAERQGHPVAADALGALALLRSGDSALSHYLAGVFLAEHCWNAPAARELKWALSLTDGKVPSNYLQPSVSRIYFELSALANQRDDDLASAHYMEAGLQKMVDSHEVENPDDLWAQVHWHYLRAARDANDPAGVKLHLDKLLLLDQDTHILDRDPGLAADIVPALQGEGRSKQADVIFESAYQSLKKKIDAAPEDPMPKNNLAWLCACSGKRLEEAVALSGQAVAQDPDNAACLDTQAEAYMRTGQPAKALEIETHALQVKPDDVYMEKQVERFRNAVNGKREK